MADYILLAGAKKNVGDFLIGDRARQLLAHYRPDRSVETWDRFLSVEGRLAEVNASRAVVLLGGPAYAPEFYPGVYPLCPTLADIRVPIIPFALGWSGGPTPDVEQFTFSAQSAEAIRWIHSRIPLSSCRDDLTRDILHRLGVDNVAMTGCAVWHHLPSEGRAFRDPVEPKRIVVTTAARRRWCRQNLALLDAVRARFPSAALSCVFHRGIGMDRHTSLPNAVFHARLARQARKLGYEVVDAAYDLGKIEFYGDCDLHIGYRVHAHLLFLSLRLPSFLIHEDGRGIGASESLGTDDVAAWDEGAIDTLLARIEANLESGFSGFARTASILDAASAEMRRFLASLP